ncbi:aldehyde dehydrogenase family protein [Mycobacterium sp. 21AC1]|uniref:aldehyde dehydrogenase family protein n=1 Tax=[Mycobacterium] appelbergii TaxID=2939269 RepID=UPI0029392B8A|nr:aldehyde dehydrogenase family protein [Mycobacterium sp. 21AC1]MDV3126847.1 aldehyde dehydrogenase family protein [Mycobacterium sp. 21AC1]
MTDTVLEPATGAVLAEVPWVDADAVDRAVQRAASAQPAWQATSPAHKAGVLLAIADGVRAQAEHLARLEARNVGMPIGDARGSIAGVAQTFRYYAAAPERLLGMTIPVADGVDMTFHEPLGVVGLITPWNFPMAIAAWKVAPALAAGNGIVLKPSELTPLTALELQRICLEAGLPEGLLNVVVGSGTAVGRALVNHPGVRKIAFTGSTAVGREISQRAGDQIKRVTLELGGKSASVVFADADLSAAAHGLVGGVFGNAGQDCCARSRVFVHRRVLDEFLDHLRDATTALRVGDPLDESTQMGPLISAQHRSKVTSYVNWAPVAFQGTAPDGPGFWFPPTVLHPIEDDHPCARDEIFGPVVCVLPFDSEAEVTQRVNTTPYGLSGSVWTADVARALRMARAIDAGALAVNSYSSVRVHTPFGGFKESGLGRELGPDAPLAYTETKNVFISTKNPGES